MGRGRGKGRGNGRGSGMGRDKSRDVRVGVTLPGTYFILVLIICKCLIYAGDLFKLFFLPIIERILRLNHSPLEWTKVEGKYVKQKRIFYFLGNAMQCQAMQCKAMQCNATQRNAMQCNVM